MEAGMRARGVRTRRIAAALLGALALVPASVAAEGTRAHDPSSCARPALWVVSDADTTIYLFGTIHTHDGRAHWFDHAVRRAFEASQSLVLETIVPSAPAEPLKSSGGLDKARQTVIAARSLGMRVDLGADLVLHRAAQAAGKPVIGLESFAEQLDMYRALPAPARPALPAAAPAASTSLPDQGLAPFLRTMVDSWNRGDARPIEAVVGAVRTQSPESYRLLFSRRNASFAEWIGHRLKAPGTVFVAIGTGHLVGNDSVQAKLALKGIPSARIN